MLSGLSQFMDYFALLQNSTRPANPMSELSLQSLKFDRPLPRPNTMPNSPEQALFLQLYSKLLTTPNLQPVPTPEGVLSSPHTVSVPSPSTLIIFSFIPYPAQREDEDKPSEAGTENKAIFQHINSLIGNVNKCTKCESYCLFKFDQLSSEVTLATDLQNYV
ncbi:hypothetical protein Ciccas_009137 [Cichlidogyrus casuarinus]|uniref:Uncharacterized protein n=1 Tax=Cichlidogyrus casuarinus TaxID=1844966 RepID=A0ABD2PXY1_9PLAT